MDNFLRAIIIFFLCNYFVHYFFARIEKKQQKKLRMQPEVICWDACVCFYWWIISLHGKSVVDTGKVK